MRISPRNKNKSTDEHVLEAVLCNSVGGFILKMKPQPKMKSKKPKYKSYREALAVVMERDKNVFEALAGPPPKEDN